MKTRLVTLTLSTLMTLSLSGTAFAQAAGPQNSSPSHYTPAPEQKNSDVFTLAQATQNQTVAVVDFNNDTGKAEYDNLKRGISESLMTKLARRPELTLVERGQLSKAIKELGFSQSVYADSSEAKAIGKMTGASYLVTGNVVKAGDRFEINVRMLDVETAKVLVSESYRFNNENDILLAVDYLSLLIPRKLGLYVSERELDLAKNQLRANNSAMVAESTNQADNSWIWWTTGGVVVAAALVGIAILALRPQQQTVRQVVVVGDDAASRFPNRTTRTGTNAVPPADQGPQWNLPLLNF